MKVSGIILGVPDSTQLKPPFDHGLFVETDRNNLTEELVGAVTTSLIQLSEEQLRGYFSLISPIVTPTMLFTSLKSNILSAVDASKNGAGIQTYLDTITRLYTLANMADSATQITLPTHVQQIIQQDDFQGKRIKNFLMNQIGSGLTFKAFDKEGTPSFIFELEAKGKGSQQDVDHIAKTVHEHLISLNRETTKDTVLHPPSVLYEYRRIQGIKQIANKLSNTSPEITQQSKVDLSLIHI